VGWGGCDPEDGSVWGLCHCGGEGVFRVAGSLIMGIKLFGQVLCGESDCDPIAISNSLPHHEDTIHMYTYSDYTT